MRLEEITAFGDTSRKWITPNASQKSPSELRDAVRRIRDGGWIQTASGLPFWPLDPRPEDVRIEDIAYALARISRFNGHTTGEIYSVGQHSVYVSEEVEREYLLRYGPTASHQSEISCLRATLVALLHDGSEAYIGDCTRPLKKQDTFAAYRTAEARLQQCIYKAFGLLYEWELDILHQADRRMLRTEQRDLMPAALPEEGRDDVPPYDLTVEPWPWREAERRFLARFAELTTT